MVKNLTANVGDSGSILGLRRTPRGRNGNSQQYSCLGNPWTEEPGGLQSVGSQRTSEDLTTEQQQQRKSKL